MKRVNKKWFKNQLKKNSFLVRCTGSQTDDYIYDFVNNFFEEGKFREVVEGEFSDWYINSSFIWGDKDGVINLAFANCQYYEFKQKS